jgi:hypothetical protein
MPPFSSFRTKQKTSVNIPIIVHVKPTIGLWYQGAFSEAGAQ